MKRGGLALVSGAVLSVVSAVPAAAQCLQVPSAAFPTISAAVSSLAGTALSGDTCISVAAGVYNERVTVAGVNTSGFQLLLESTGPMGGAVVAPPGGSLAAFVLDNSGVELEGFIVAPSTGGVPLPTYGVLVSSPGVVLNQLQIQDGAGAIQAAALALAGPAASGVSLQNSSILEGNPSAFALYGTDSSSDVVSNSVVRNTGGGDGAFFDGGGFEQISGSTLTTMDAPDAAVYFLNASSNAISNSTVQDYGPGACDGGGGGDGLVLDGLGGTVLNYSTVATNGAADAAVYVADGSSYNSITGGVLQDAAYSDALLLGAGFNSISQSALSGNASASCGNAVLEINGDDNNVSNIVVSDPGTGPGTSGGIFFDPGADSNVVQDAVVTTTGAAVGAVYFEGNDSGDLVTGGSIGDAGGAGALYFDANGGGEAGNTVSSGTILEVNDAEAAVSLDSAAANLLSGLAISQPSGGDGLDLIASGGNTLTLNTIATDGAVNGALYLSGSSDSNTASASSIADAQATAVRVEGGQNAFTDDTISGGYAGLESDAVNGITVSGSTLEGEVAAGWLEGSGITLAGDTWVGIGSEDGLSLVVEADTDVTLTSNTVTGGSEGIVFTQVTFGLSVSTLVFSGMSPGATDLQLSGGVWVATFSYVDFLDPASNDETNVNASALDSGSSVVLLNSTGPSSGAGFEVPLDSPYIEWETIVVPPAPQDLGATPRGSTSILWTWTEPAGSTVTAFNFYPGGDGTPVSLPATATSYLETGLAVNASTSAGVSALNTTLESGLSTASTATFANAPLDLAATGVSSSTLSVSWQSNGDPAYTAYVAQAWVGGSTQTVSLTGNTTTFSGLSPSTTYNLQVYAENVLGVPTAAATAAGMTSPAPPAGLQGVGESSTTILWSWTADGASSYNVYLATASSIVAANVSADSFTETGLSPNATGGVEVAGVSASGVASALSAPATAYTLAAVPGQPYLATATVSSLSIEWPAQGNPLPGTCYRVAYSTAAGLGADATTQVAVSTFTTLAGLSAGTRYYYDVAAINGAGVQTSYTGDGDNAFTLPAAPASAVGIAQGVSSISWTWGAVAGATSYGLYAASAAATLLANVGGPPFVEAGLSTNAPAGLVVAALDPSGAGALSAAATQYTFAAVPAGLTEVSANGGSLSVEWSGNGNPAYTAYVVNYSSAAGLFSSSFTVAGSTSADIAGLGASTSYYLEVKAENGSGSYSAPGPSIVVLTAPGAPAGLEGSALGVSSIAWTWNPVAGAAGYKFYFSTGLPAAYVTAATLTQTALATNTAYGASVAAVAAAGDSVESSSASVFTLAAPPLNLRATDIGVSSITFTWATNGNPAGTGYELAYQAVANGGVVAAAGTGPPFTLDGLSGGTRYAFSISALNGDGIPALGASIVAQTASASNPSSSGIKAFPNPLRPALGDTAIAFIGLPAQATLDIYDILGEKVRELSADASGLAAWDGRNANGNACASGVYFVLAGSGGSRATLKVAIQR